MRCINGIVNFDFAKRTTPRQRVKLVISGWQTRRYIERTLDICVMKAPRDRVYNNISRTIGSCAFFFAILSFSECISNIWNSRSAVSNPSSKSMPRDLYCQISTKAVIITRVVFTRFERDRAMEFVQANSTIAAGQFYVQLCPRRQSTEASENA